MLYNMFFSAQPISFASNFAAVILKTIFLP